MFKVKYTIFSSLAMLFLFQSVTAQQWYALKHKASGLYLNFPATASDNPKLSATATPVCFAHTADGATVQNAEGEFLSANSNGWSINSTTDASKAMSVMVSPLADGTVTLRYRNGTGFGTDATTSDSKVFYDKNRRNENSRFTLEPVSSTATFEGKFQTFQACMENQGEVTLKKAGDIHLWSSEPLKGTTLNFQSNDAWLICDHVLPADFIDKYLQYIKVNGEKAVLNQNIRVAIWRDGCAVIPHDTRYQAFTAYHDANLQGKSISLAVGNHTNLDASANEISSFVLKRGYMATVATQTDGGGYSRVYVADHADVVVNQLPTATDNRISMVSVRKWNYNNKKGWASTTANTGQANSVRANWIYSWSAGYNSSSNQEYAPHKSHMYWPGWSEINGKNNSNHVLGYNEPDHSEQHDNCDCNGVISAWTAFQHSEEFLQSGMRIGSPSPTDVNWISDYAGYLDGYARRCDFVTFHSYWTGDANSWKSQLENIHNKTKRPIWITEMEYGASWLDPGYSDVSTAENKYRAIFNLLETLDYVEAYFPYNTDLWFNRMIYEQGGLTPAGQQFRDWDSDFAYKAREQFVPLWWQPAASNVSIKSALSSDGKTLTLTTNNPNLDYTTALYIERENLETGEWITLITDNNRPSFDNQNNTYTLDISTLNLDLQRDQLRLRVMLNTGKEVVSEAITASLLQNGSIITSNKDNVPGWTCVKSAQNGYTKSTGDTYLEVWDVTAQGMQFDYYQLIPDLPAGYYELSALCFNSANGVETDSVNGAVVLYASTPSLRYSEPVLQESVIDDSLRLTIPYIYIAVGDTLRVGIRNAAPMTARWAGADDFQLRYLGKAVSALNTEATLWTKEQLRQRSSDILLSGTKTQVERALNSTATSLPFYQRAAAAMAVLNQERYMRLLDAQDTHVYDLTALIVNPNAQRADAYGWQAQNVQFDAANAWDGSTSGNSYFNYWSGNTWPSTLKQTITDLPAGDYQLSCLARGSSTADFTLSALVEDNVLATTKINGQGDATISTSPYVKGWMPTDTLSFSLKQGEKLTLWLQCTASGSAWWSADEFTLRYLIPHAPVGISGINSTKENDKTFTLQGTPAGKNHQGVVVSKGKKTLQNR